MCITSHPVPRLVPLPLPLLCVCLMALAPGPAHAQSTPGGQPMPPQPPRPATVAIDQAIEVGAGFGVFDSDLGQSNDQFFRYRISRYDDFSLGLDVGREHRFEDTAIRGGVSFSKSIPGGPAFSIGWSTGSGDVLAPRYRVDVGITQPVADVLVSVGYTRLQSKAENASDGYTIGVLRYFDRWIVGGNARVDVGFPGRTLSSSVGGGVTWYRYKEIYIGGDVTWGDVSYILLPDERAVVDYRSFGASASFSRWFDQRAGFNVKALYGNNEIYQSAGVVVSVFREF